jgi:hypothetical protein
MAKGKSDLIEVHGSNRTTSLYKAVLAQFLDSFRTPPVPFRVFRVRGEITTTSLVHLVLPVPQC